METAKIENEDLKTLNVEEALEKCTSLVGDSTTNKLYISTIATFILTVLFESAGMAVKLSKIIPEGPLKKEAEKIYCDRLDNLEARAKELFNEMVVELIKDPEECKMIVSALDADINTIVE